LPVCGDAMTKVARKQTTRRSSRKRFDATLSSQPDPCQISQDTELVLRFDLFSRIDNLVLSGNIIAKQTELFNLLNTIRGDAKASTDGDSDVPPNDIDGDGIKLF